MKKKIAILGSTGSIGKTTLEVIKNDTNFFNVVLLSTNTNYKKILKQAKLFNVKNIIIHNEQVFLKKKTLFKKKKINIFNNIRDFKKKLKFKIDYTMSSIVGIEGLQPTLESISFSKNIAIANKESIICGWNLIKKELVKHKVNFKPIDSEHFSISELIKNYQINDIKKIFITASGGPFLNWSKKKIYNAKFSSALKHPSWSMGKKISIDSATLMNKVFEIIEAKRIFNIPSDKIDILIHEQSYIHSIVHFKDGLIKVLIHETDMKIPIFNSLYDKKKKEIETKKIDLKILNNLNLKSVDKKKFPSVKLLDKMSEGISLLDTLLVSSNDELVDLYLKNKVKFYQIPSVLTKMINLKRFRLLKFNKPKNIKEILELNKYVRLKTRSFCI
jgi:1-deoxy-D-xylulose-5-phosphate reductoisomerase